MNDDDELLLKDGDNNLNDRKLKKNDSSNGKSFRRNNRRALVGNRSVTSSAVPNKSMTQILKDNRSNYKLTRQSSNIKKIQKINEKGLFEAAVKSITLKRRTAIKNDKIDLAESLESSFEQFRKDNKRSLAAYKAAKKEIKSRLSILPVSSDNNLLSIASDFTESPSEKRNIRSLNAYKSVSVKTKSFISKASFSLLNGGNNSQCSPSPLSSAESEAAKRDMQLSIKKKKERKRRLSSIPYSNISDSSMNGTVIRDRKDLSSIQRGSIFSSSGKEERAINLKSDTDNIHTMPIDPSNQENTFFDGLTQINDTGHNIIIFENNNDENEVDNRHIIENERKVKKELKKIKTMYIKDFQKMRMKKRLKKHSDKGKQLQMQRDQAKTWQETQVAWEQKLLQSLKTTASLSSGGYSTDFHPATTGMGLVKQPVYNPEVGHTCFYGYRYKSTKTNYSLNSGTQTGNSSFQSTAGFNSSRKGTSRNRSAMNSSRSAVSNNSSRVGTSRRQPPHSSKGNRGGYYDVSNSVASSARSSARSSTGSRCQTNPMTGLPFEMVDPFTGEVLEPDGESGRYVSKALSSSRSNKSSLSNSDCSTVGTVSLMNLSSLNLLSHLAMEPLNEYETADDNVNLPKEDAFDPMDYLVAPKNIRDRCNLDTYDCSKWHPVCPGYAMIQSREPYLESDGNFEVSSPIWYCYTHLFESQLQHLPHSSEYQRAWSPITTGYAMLLDKDIVKAWEETSSKVDEFSINTLIKKSSISVDVVVKHPVFAGYSDIHWLELIPDPVDQTNPVAKYAMTRCGNAPNTHAYSRVKWNPETWSPIYLGYCPHAEEETRDTHHHKPHPATIDYKLEHIQVWDSNSLSPIFFGYKSGLAFEDSDDTVANLNQSKVEEHKHAVTLNVKLTPAQIERKKTRCSVCNATIPGCPGCYGITKKNPFQKARILNTMTKLSPNGKSNANFKHKTTNDLNRYKYESPQASSSSSPSIRNMKLNSSHKKKKLDPLLHTSLVDASSIRAARESVVFLTLYIKALPNGNITIIKVSNDTPMLYLYFIYRIQAGVAGLSTVHLVLPTHRGIWYLNGRYDPGSETQAGILHGLNLKLKDFKMTRTASIGLFNLVNIHPEFVRSILSVYYKQNLPLETNKLNLELHHYLDNLPPVVPMKRGDYSVYGGGDENQSIFNESSIMTEGSLWTVGSSLTMTTSKSNAGSMLDDNNSGAADEFDGVQQCLMEVLRYMFASQEQMEKQYAKEEIDKLQGALNSLLKKRMKENQEVKRIQTQKWIDDRAQKVRRRDRKRRVRAKEKQEKMRIKAEKEARRDQRLAIARGEIESDHLSSSKSKRRRKNTLSVTTNSRAITTSSTNIKPSNSTPSSKIHLDSSSIGNDNDYNNNIVEQEDFITDASRRKSSRLPRLSKVFNSFGLSKRLSKRNVDKNKNSVVTSEVDEKDQNHKALPEEKEDEINNSNDNTDSDDKNNNSNRLPSIMIPEISAIISSSSGTNQSIASSNSNKDKNSMNATNNNHHHSNGTKLKQLLKKSPIKSSPPLEKAPSALQKFIESGERSSDSKSSKKRKKTINTLLLKTRQKSTIFSLLTKK